MKFRSLLGLWVWLWVATVPSLAQAPVITEQPPLSVFANPGDSVTLSVQATGEVVYIWRFNGFNIPQQNSATLTLPAVTPADAGSYSVFVTSVFDGSVVSRICVLEVNGPGGAVNFSNLAVDQPIYDSDGVTGLSGDGYLALLYAGATVDSLAPVGAAVPFQTGNGAGYWRGGVRNLTGIAPGSPAVVQVRIWELGKGRNFEQALTVGSKVGVSGLVRIPATGGFGEPPALPAALAGLTSFKLGPVVPLALATQPNPVETTVGGALRLQVGVAGSGVFAYQWQRNGVDIAGATSEVLERTAATVEDAGAYRVRVLSVLGTLTSRTVVVGVNEPGGKVFFDNAALRVPVTGEDGTTGLAGDGYLAQLYAGATSAELRPVSAAVPFNTGPLAGYWVGGTRSVPGIPPGSAAVVQVRVWETSAGPSFEAALAAGRPVGTSRVLALTLGGPGTGSPSGARLTGLTKFSLIHPTPPQITQALRAVPADFGQPFQLTVRASGMEPLFYDWQKNGVTLASTTNPRLEPAPAVLATAGSYTVVVRNAFGEVVSGPLALEALIPPAISVPPVAQTVVMGAPVAFTVVAGGTGPLSYQWRRDGVDIPGALDATFQIGLVQAADAGPYSVVVSNSAGFIESPAALLRIDLPPSLTAEPEDIRLDVGAYGVLGVVATGTAPLTYQWEFNGRAIPGATGREFPLTGVTSATSGAYRVRVRNSAGSALSRFALVTVVTAGGSVQFSNVGLHAPVTAADGVSSLAGDDFLAQLYAGPDLDLLQPVPGAVPFARRNAAGLWRGGTRQIPTLAPGATAVLQVRVWETAAGVSFEEARAAGHPVGISVAVPAVLGGVGEPPSLPVSLGGLLPFSLTAWTPPTITAAPTPVDLVAGQSLHLAVAAEGTAPLRYVWHRNTTILPVDGPILDVPAVTAADAGDYRVEVNNWVGRVETLPVTVGVRVPPAMVAQPQSLVRVMGAAAHFEVAVTGSLPLTFQWTKDGVDLAGAQSAVWEIPAVQTADAGAYRVRVANTAGTILSDAATLSVGVAPEIAPLPGSLAAVTGADVTLIAVVSGTAPLTYQWLKDGAPVLGGTFDRLELHAVTVADAGRYQVRVTNDFGSGLGSETRLTVETPVNLAGTAVDGYIVDATVFFDANRNGVLDPGEPHTTTDRQGKFSLDISLERFDRNHDGILDVTEGRLVRTGGVDLATGLAAEMPAVGPVGSKALGPLSSLVDAVQASAVGLSVREAEQIVAAGLNLPRELELTQIDPIAAAVAGHESARQLLNAAAQVQDTLIQVVSVVDAGGGGSDSAAASVLDSLARSLGPTGPIDLTAPDRIGQLIEQSAEREGLKLPQGLVATASQIVAEGNQTTHDAAQTGTPLEVAGRISRIQAVVQGPTADDLADAAAGRQPEAEILARNTGEQLDRQIDTRVGGDLLGTEVRPGTFSFGPEVPRVLENGQVIQALTVLRAEGNRGAVRLRVRFTADTATEGADFKALVLVVDFTDGETIRTVDLGSILVNDETPETTESLLATLELEDGAPVGAKLGDHVVTRVYIEDDDAAGSFAFATDALEVGEDGRFVRRLFVERSQGVKGTVNLMVRPRAVAGGASPGRDFDATPVPLTFGPGQRLAQVVVPVVVDDLYELNEEAGLELTLGEPSAVGATLGARQTARLVIVNDEQRAPQLRIAGRWGAGAESAGLQILGPVDQRVGIEVSDDLDDWARLSDGVIGSAGVYELPLDRARLGRFYRISAKP